MYKYYNANAHNNFVDDCTIRAISLAEDLTWNEAYYKLSNLARNSGLMMDDVNFIEDYLDDRYPRECFSKMSVGEFVDKHQAGIYLITMPGHITVSINGTIFDTFNCSDRIMRCAWRVD